MRGQMLLFGANPGTITRMVLEGSRYVIPRRDGRILFGSTIDVYLPASARSTIEVGHTVKASCDGIAELMQS